MVEFSAQVSIGSPAFAFTNMTEKRHLTERPCYTVTVHVGAVIVAVAENCPDFLAGKGQS